jgi:hypothetical protein
MPWSLRIFGFHLIPIGLRKNLSFTLFTLSALSTLLALLALLALFALFALFTLFAYYFFCRFDCQAVRRLPQSAIAYFYEPAYFLHCDMKTLTLL